MNNTLLYEFSDKLVGYINYDIAKYLPIIIVILFIFRQSYFIKIDAFFLLGIMILIPSFSPIGAELFGFRYFTAMNFDLQQDEALKLSGIILISLFVFSYLVSMSRIEQSQSITKWRQIRVDIYTLSLIGIISIVLCSLYLESGNIIFSSYADFKIGPVDNPYSSLANQGLNLAMALFFTHLGSRHRRKIVFIFFITVIILSIVVSRRTLMIGSGLILLSFYYKEISQGRNLIYFITLFALAFFIGEVRKYGLINFIDGSYVAKSAQNFSLPGGASNIFLSTLGVIDLLNSDNLTTIDQLPFLQWISGRNESVIYQSYGYDYNGGMHLSAVLYWNFGLLGVVLFGYAFGRIIKKCTYVIENCRGRYGGTFPAMLSVSVFILSTNIIWYGVIGIIKLTVAVSVGYILMCLIYDASER